MPNTGLSLNDVVNVSVSLTPTAAQQRNFGSLLILGDSQVIDTQQRMRLYTSLAGVAGDFGASGPEYSAAALFFGQSPQPAQCYVGRWASAATPGVLQGGALSPTQQLLANFTGISNGGIGITINGTVYNLTGINLSAATNLNGVASAITTALGGSGTVTWNATNGNFAVASGTTGAASTVAFAPVGAGADLSALMGLGATGGGYTVAGINAESLLAAVTALDQMSTAWYGLQIAATAAITDAQYVGVAGYIEAASVSRIFGVTTQEAGALSSVSTTDLASLLQTAGYGRTFVQYSSSSPYASASIFGRAFTVNFNGAGTVITLKFQQEPGIVPELLTESQAAALGAKNCNVFVTYNNQIAILQQGTMASGQFFDVRHGADWLQNAAQTAVFNTLFTSGTKVPQTDPGVNQLVAAVTATCDQARLNGLFAPGVWNGPPVGNVATGQTLSLGYYVYAPSIASQSQADRSARRAPVIQVAGKLAGAIHSSNVLVSINQ
jgi:hypothetical protein